MSGGRLREYELLKRLARRFEIDLCVVTKTYEEDVEFVPQLERLCSRVSVFAAQPRPRAADGAAHLPSQVRAHRSPRATAFVRDALDDADLVHVEGFYMAQHVPDPCPRPLLQVEQNIEYFLWLQRAEVASGEARISYLLEYARTREAERRSWLSADACAALTEEDRATMLRAYPWLDVRLVPDGVDHLVVERDAAPLDSRPSIVYVGNFAYEPNVDAARRLCDEILPRVTARVPDAHVTLVGNSAPPSVSDLARPNVTITGRVPDVTRYLDAAHVVAVPLRVGGGVKVKVLEALNRGKAIVTTPIGAQGLTGAGSCMRVEEHTARFADAIVQVLRDAQERRRLERAARFYARGLPRWDDAADALAATWSRLGRTLTVAG